MYGDLSKRFEALLLSVNTKDRKFFQDVYNFSYEAHKGQKRKSGEDYFIHPLAVALRLHDQFSDKQLTCAGLLHDTVEDNPEVSIKEIYNKFGFEIGYIVDAVTKNKQTYYGSNYAFDRKIDKFLFGGVNNIKCFLLKIADREDNLKTITNLKDNKQVRMAFETQAIFTPLETIIGSDRVTTINQAQINLDKCIKEKKIAGYLELKDYLINKTFMNFSAESFDAVYQNTANVSWKITNINRFKEFMKIKNIDDRVDIETIQINENGNFLAIIKFKKGEIMNKNVELSIGDSYSF